MKKNMLIGIDVGSTNIKSVVFDRNLNILANQSKEVEILFPNPGWTEYDPDDWWNYVKETLQLSIQKANINPAAIAGIGVSSLGCCTVPLDSKGDHLYNAIPWSDQRAGEEVEFLENNCRDRIYAACGNIPTVLSATPHLMWLKNHEPEAYSRTYKYTEASGYIVQKLTGEFVLDYSIASALDYGFDIHRLDYDPELIDAMGLDLDKYPRLHENRKPVAGLSQKAAQETGLLEGTPVYLGGLDIVTGALAGGAVRVGQGFYSMGSASNMMIVADKKHQSEYMTSVMHVTDPGFKILFGSQATIGFSLKWFAEQFGDQEKQAANILGDAISNFEIMTAEAMKTAPGAGGIIYFPYLFGKFHPVFNPHASGAFFGITATSTKSQMIRSIMEGCTFNMYETIKSASQIGIELDEIITSGGPTNSQLWCQIISDVTNTKVVTINTPEATPLGNAILVGVGEGLFESFEQATEQFIKRERTYQPDAKRHELYEELFGLYNRIYQSLVPRFEDHATLKKRFFS
jgi:xylulokinase